MGNFSFNKAIFFIKVCIFLLEKTNNMCLNHKSLNINLVIELLYKINVLFLKKTRLSSCDINYMKLYIYISSYLKLCGHVF